MQNKSKNSNKTNIIFIYVIRKLVRMN